MKLDVIVPVYNGHQALARLLPVLLTQHGQGLQWRRIIVVDDGSDPPLSESVSATKSPRVDVLHLNGPSGRAAACNAGVRHSGADAVFILDVDCIPQRDDLLSRHGSMLDAGADASFGPIGGEGTGIWQALADSIEARRARAAANDSYVALTTACLGIRRTVFDQAGGFHEGYTHYGFEDRDLLATLKSFGCRFSYDEQARVLHAADASLAVLCEKFYAAGRYSAPLFAQRHPLIYRSLPYEMFDIDRVKRIRRAVLRVASLGYAPAQVLVARLVEREWLPVGWRRELIRAVTALAFLRGSMDR